MSAEVTPYFDDKSMSVGVNVDLAANFEQTVTEALELVSDFISNSTSNSTADPSMSKLGLQNSSDALELSNSSNSSNANSSDALELGNSSNALVIDLGELLSKTTLAAGLDVSFGIDFNLAEIQKGFTGHPFDEALSKGISLYIETWGAFAEIIGKFLICLQLD